MVNSFISVPRDKSSLNCAAFVGGMLEAILTDANFVSAFFIVPEVVLYLQPCKVTVHWHKGTTYVIEFDESVIARDKALETR